MQPNKVIYVTFQLPGIHCYPDAPEDVSYLRSPHRHLFHFKVSIEVFHADRCIEFHQFKNWLLSLFNTSVLELDFKSCEMISDELAKKVREKYSNRWLQVEVSEDGECGSIATYPTGLRW